MRYRWRPETVPITNLNRARPNKRVTYHACQLVLNVLLETVSRILTYLDSATTSRKLQNYGDVQGDGFSSRHGDFVDTVCITRGKDWIIWGA